IGMVLASERERLDPVLGLQCTIAVSHEEIVEELHIEIVVFYDQDLLPHRRIGVLVRFRQFKRHPSPTSRNVLKWRRRGRSQSSDRLSAAATLVGCRGSSLTIRNL